ncbi:MAG: CPBP family intramembrane metalloprotease [Anaerolineales bacterium]|nr:CPBP family intramembrane metalloprotease [Anaerolineales bacterium]
MQNRNVPLKWHEIGLFTLLSYGLSWLWWGALFLSGASAFSNLSQANADEIQAAQIMLAIGDFGPLIAALIMRLLVSKEGLKGSVGWWRSWKFYLFAFLSPILFFSLLALFNHLTGLGRFEWTRSDMPLSAYIGIELLIGALIISVFVFGEEYGWRGYLLPRSLALGEIRGTILVGLIWAGWHLPLLLIGLNYPGQSPLLAIPLFTLAVICLSFPFTWFYKATAGSVVLASLFHGAINAYGDGLTALEVVPNGNPLVTGSAGPVLALALLGLILLVYRLRKPKTV